MDRALDANRPAVQHPPLRGAAIQRDARYMVEKGTMSEAEALARKHPIAAFTLDALTAGAAKLRPERLALAEAGPGLPAQALSYGAFDGRVRAAAQHLVDLGLAPGERV